LAAGGQERQQGQATWVLVSNVSLAELFNLAMPFVLAHLTQLAAQFPGSSDTTGNADSWHNRCWTRLQTTINRQDSSCCRSWQPIPHQVAAERVSRQRLSKRRNLLIHLLRVMQQQVRSMEVCEQVLEICMRHSSVEATINEGTALLQEGKQLLHRCNSPGHRTPRHHQSAAAAAAAAAAAEQQHAIFLHTILLMQAFTSSQRLRYMVATGLRHGSQLYAMIAERAYIH
jgi:hypothetical protein